MSSMCKLSFIAIFFCFLTTSVQALELQEKTVKNPLTIESVSVPNPEVKEGDRFPVTVNVLIHNDFYVYEEKVKLSALAPDGLALGDLRLTPVISFVDFAGKQHKGLNQKATLQFFVEIPSKLDKSLQQILINLEYVACTQKFCLPLAQREISIPVNLSSNQSSAPASASSMIEDKISQNIFLAYLLIFFFGFLTSLTPCIYPLIPITLAVIGARTSQSTRSQAFLLSFVYVLGISVTYSVLGVIAAKTGALFGQALSYPPVVMAFVILFVLMALSIYGYFEIRIPHSISRRLEKSGPSHGFVGAFSSGLVAGVVASPCVGPVLVGVLAYIAKSQNVLLGFSLLFTFAMGMGVLFLLLGTFSTFFKKIPRSGGWMDGVKFILGSILLGVALYYLKPLLPYFWYLMCAAMLTVAGIFIFIAKIYPKTDRRWIHRMPIVFCLLMILSPLVSSNRSRWFATNDSQRAGAVYQNGWQAYSEEAVQKAKEQGRAVVIDFFADWCAACIELDEKTFSQKQFIENSRDLVLLKVDATETFPELADLQRKYKIYGLPTIVFIRANGEVDENLTLTGFEELEPMLMRIQELTKKN